jgi:catechol 2,3-dioxygenase-like lactoylglutathione lyase family enzyme
MINGIQHIGLGVTDRDRAFRFYKDVLGFAVTMSKHSGNCNGVLPLIEKDETRDVVIALNPYGGGLVELFQYTSKTPKPIPRKVDFTYNGYLFFGLKVKNVGKALEFIERNGGVRVSGPADFTPMRDAGWKTAMFKDPEGIYGVLIEYPGNNVGYGRGKSRIGGVEYVAIGVSDIDKSVDFYSRVLGYDRILYRTEGKAPEWEPAFKNGSTMKRALLQKSRKVRGTFRHFLRGGMIELIEVEGNCGKNNFDGRKWGDIGLMEITFDVTDIEESLKTVTSLGYSIAANCYDQDMGMNTHATFAYFRDPDGSLLEFADIKSLPVPYFVIRLFVNPFVVGIARKLKIIR